VSLGEIGTACERPPSPFGATAFACIHERRLVSRIFASWNLIDGWLRRVEALR
jgi:hypothetical protein